MADLYEPGFLPVEYDSNFIQDEFRRIAEFLGNQEVAMILLVPQAQEPDKLYEGLIINANGTDWNPGAGAGVYAYVGGAWSKL